MGSVLGKRLVRWTALILVAVMGLSPLGFGSLPAVAADSEITLAYYETGDATGKLYLENIGDTVFDAITYGKSGDRADKVTLGDDGTINADDGYTIATSGEPGQAVTFTVNATYYKDDDVLFAENFESAGLGDKGIANGGYQQFSGTYGPNAAPTGIRGTAYEMPIVMDPTKARAGSKAITQGPVSGQNATDTQADNIKAPLGQDAKDYLAGNDAVATMWYYDDGSDMDLASQYAFMGGLVNSSWTSGAFNAAMGASYQTSAATTPAGVYVKRSGSGNTWSSTGVARTKGWHKFQWKIGAESTTFMIDGIEISGSSPVTRSNVGAFQVVFNWNNMRVPFNNRHFIDSFYMVKATATASETLTRTITLYVERDDDSIDPEDPNEGPLTGVGAREIVSLNADWRFGGKGVLNASEVAYDDGTWQTVNVPHDWNAVLGSGGGSHDDGTYWYRKTLTLTQEEADYYNGRGAFLEFDAVGMESNVYLNGVRIGGHKGGWTAFHIDVTGRFIAGVNVIAVSANNQRVLNGDISPLWGDFNNASGINRDVRLVLTSPIHFDELDYGSSGVYMIPQRSAGWDAENNDRWQVDVQAWVANDTMKTRQVTVTATIKHPTSFDNVLNLPKDKLRFDPDKMYDLSGAVVGTAVKTVDLLWNRVTAVKFTAENIMNPNLWDGVTSPYQYVAEIKVYEGSDTSGALLDTYTTMIGFRYYEAIRTDSPSYGAAGDGFYLNGRLYPLRGMAMHKDWPGLGRALENKYIEKDVEVLLEMGANWTRVSHYPHDRYTYDLLGRYGIACSAEIPLVDGVSLVNQDGSYTSSKTTGILSPGFKQTTLDQLSDMVKQNYNYPSILGWLLQNELGGGTYGQGSGANAKAAQSEMITALNDLAHLLDPGRKTVMAMSLSHCYEYDSDYLLWNGYPGWYDSSYTTGIGYFVDGYANSTAAGRNRPTGVSEYGAGVNPWHHMDYVAGTNPGNGITGTGGAFHPEEYGNFRHEMSLREINSRPFFWATAGWIMYDFAAASRNEGGRLGINDKGLVRKERPADVPGYSGDPEELLLRKDAFYLYKANWNPDPMTYIAERRYNPRLVQNIPVTVYSNANKVELWHNGVLVDTMYKTPHAAYTSRSTVDPETSSCIFKFDITLAVGGNLMEAKGYDGGQLISSDSIVWQYGDPVGMDITSDVFEINNTAKTIILTGSGNAEDIYSLIRPANSGETLAFRVLTSAQQPVSEGLIKEGMLLEVKRGMDILLYRFQQPYISALKPVTLDGAADVGLNKAVDFKDDTVWAAADTNAHSLQVDLGKKYVLSEIKVNWKNAGEATGYKVLTSNDGIVWNTAADRSANAVADGIAQNELQSYGRYVRLDIAAGTSPVIAEIEVYGWMVSLKGGETRIFVSETERTICVPTDIPDFHIGQNMQAGMVFTNVEPLIVVEGNCQAAYENYDYSLDFNTAKYVITDTLGRNIPFRFMEFTGGIKPDGPFELGIGKPATCSSTQTAAFPAINATTEDDTRWNSYAQGLSGLNEWIMADLGAVCALDSLRLEFPRNGVGGITSNRYYRYEVYIGDSADGPFELVIDQSGNTDMSGLFEFSSEVSGKSARFVRVKVTGNSAGYQVGLNRLYVRGWGTASHTDGVSLSVTTPTLVAKCAANLNISVKDDFDKALTAYLIIGGNQLYPTALNHKSGVMRIGAGVLEAGTYDLIVKGEGIYDSCKIEVVEYKPELLWQPETRKGEDGKLEILFGDVISAKAAGVTVTLKTQILSAEIVKGTPLLRIDIPYEEAVGDIVVSGIQYAELFPSYSFTFIIKGK